MDREHVELAPNLPLSKPAGKGALETNVEKEFREFLEEKRFSAFDAPEAEESKLSETGRSLTEEEDVLSETLVVEGELRLGFPVGNPPSAPHGSDGGSY